MSGKVRLLEMGPLRSRDTLFDVMRAKGVGRVYVSFDLFFNFGW